MAKDKWTKKDVEDILMDVRTTGVGGFPRIVSDDEWIKVNVTRIKEIGPQKYLELLLAKLQRDFGSADED